MQAVEGKTGRVRRTLIDFSIARSLHDHDFGNGNHDNDNHDNDDGDYGDAGNYGDDGDDGDYGDNETDKITMELMKKG